MNPENPQSPDEQLEARITALLLGELSPAEAEELREAMEQNPALKELHDRLQLTIEMVREVVSPAHEKQPEPQAPIRLAPERREKLLAHFKTIRPLHLAEIQPERRRHDVPWYIPISVAAAALFLVISLGGYFSIDSRMDSPASSSEPYFDMAELGDLDSDGAVPTSVTKGQSKYLYSWDTESAASKGEAKTPPIRNANSRASQSKSARRVLSRDNRGQSGSNSKLYLPSGGKVANNAPLDITRVPQSDAPSDPAGKRGFASNYGGYGGGGYGGRGKLGRRSSRDTVAGEALIAEGIEIAQFGDNRTSTVSKKSDQNVLLGIELKPEFETLDVAPQLAEHGTHTHWWGRTDPAPDKSTKWGAKTGDIISDDLSAFGATREWAERGLTERTDLASLAAPRPATPAQPRLAPAKPVPTDGAVVAGGLLQVDKLERFEDLKEMPADEVVNLSGYAFTDNGATVARGRAAGLAGIEEESIERIPQTTTTMNGTAGGVAEAAEGELTLNRVRKQRPAARRQLGIGGGSGVSGGANELFFELAEAESKSRVNNTRGTALASELRQQAQSISGGATAKAPPPKPLRPLIVDEEFDARHEQLSHSTRFRSGEINHAGAEVEKRLAEIPPPAVEMKSDYAGVTLSKKQNEKSNRDFGTVALAADEPEREPKMHSVNVVRNIDLKSFDASQTYSLSGDSQVTFGNNFKGASAIPPTDSYGQGLLRSMTNSIESYFDNSEAGLAAAAPEKDALVDYDVLFETKSGKPLSRTRERTHIALPQLSTDFSSPEPRGELTKARIETAVAGRPVTSLDMDFEPTSGPETRAKSLAPKKKPKSIEDLATKRSPSAPVPQPEVQTTDSAFSTFSLNVADVSFKLAAASLEKGTMPDVATVRSEEFINALDYRDPMPRPGQPIAFAWERARYPFAHNRDLLRFSVQTAARGREPGRPLNLVLLLDNSGSMERADRVRIIQECLLVLAAQLQSQDRVSVVTFARTARLWADGLPGNTAAKSFGRVGTLTPQGGTNLEEAMNLAYQTALRHYLPQGVNRVVVLTDGAANLGNVDPEGLKQKVEAFRKQGVALDCFGIGWEGYNDDLLEILSRNGDGRYGFVNSPEAATTEFAGQLAGALQVAASDVKVQVEFNPQRVTTYRQIGYAKHQLKKEQFRDNTVDAAEIGAAESGNALYAVQVDPHGQGPLAVVRVRYKVPGTRTYHEREWAVPYDGEAAPLEQASPAMRLAASASAFSEWLVSSPYAAEVTTDRLLNYLSGVPAVYGADPRPKQLEWMIRQAKSIAGR